MNASFFFLLFSGLFLLFTNHNKSEQVGWKSKVGLNIILYNVCHNCDVKMTSFQYDHKPYLCQKIILGLQY